MAVGPHPHRLSRLAYARRVLRDDCPLRQQLVGRSPPPGAARLRSPRTARRLSASSTIGGAIPTAGRGAFTLAAYFETTVRFVNNWWGDPHRRARRVYPRRVLRDDCPLRQQLVGPIPTVGRGALTLAAYFETTVRFVNNWWAQPHRQARRLRSPRTAKPP